MFKNHKNIIPTSNLQLLTSKSGFTLIEIMVSVAIFATVMTIGAGSMLSILDANAKAQSLKSVMNNLNLALEGMSRSIRVGTTYHCGNSGILTAVLDCDGESYFAFEKSGGDPGNSGDQVVYKLQAGRIEKSSDGGGSFIAVTAPEVVVEDLKFYTTGSSTTDSNQPRVLIIVRGYAGTKEKTRSDFDIQTSVTQRQLDISI